MQHQAALPQWPPVDNACRCTVGRGLEASGLDEANFPVHRNSLQGEVALLHRRQVDKRCCCILGQAEALEVSESAEDRGLKVGCLALQHFLQYSLCLDRC